MSGSWTINSAACVCSQQVKMARKGRHRGCKRQDEAVRTTPKHSVEKRRGQRARDSAKATERQARSLRRDIADTLGGHGSSDPKRLFKEGRVEESKEKTQTDSANRNRNEIKPRRSPAGAFSLSRGSACKNSEKHLASQGALPQ